MPSYQRGLAEVMAELHVEEASQLTDDELESQRRERELALEEHARTAKLLAQSRTVEVVYLGPPIPAFKRYQANLGQGTGPLRWTEAEAEEDYRRHYGS